ncbi:MAG: homocysteine S-methyltransferase family protein [Elusimicrobia bacterium]|nr:homocysteine S-methyltransferase family protein [Elusimicrobiota bacterium]
MFRIQDFDFSAFSDEKFGDSGIDFSSAEPSEISYRLSRIGAEISKKAIGKYMKMAEYDGRPLFVFGSMGPSNRFLSPSPATLKRAEWEDIEKNYYFHSLGLIDGGADVLLLETQQDILEVKAAFSGCLLAMKERGKKIPLILQVTVDRFSRMSLFNTDILSAFVTVQDIGIDVFGINCSIGPDLMEPAVQKISKYSKVPFSVVPNAGLPFTKDGKVIYDFPPKKFAAIMERFALKYGANIVGGCCGTTPEHIREISKRVRGRKPAERKIDKRIFVSGPQNAVPINAGGLLQIGERLNVRGSKKVREAVEKSKEIDFDALEEVKTGQEELGLKILDICLDSNAYDVKNAMRVVLSRLLPDFGGAFSIDSFDPEVFEAAVKVYPGRPILNSISLEKYGDSTKADVVIEKTVFHRPVYIAMLSDEGGPAKTAKQKLEIAEKLAGKCRSYGVGFEDIFFDVGIFPVGSEGDAPVNFAVESLDAISLIAKLDKKAKTIVGVGNLSAGFHPLVRRVLTSVFLAEAVSRGLAAAIVNPNNFIPVESIPSKERKLAERAIFGKDSDALDELERAASLKKGGRKISLSSRAGKVYDSADRLEAVVARIKDGYRQSLRGKIERGEFNFEYSDGIIPLVFEIFSRKKPLDFVSENLISAMNELGDKFADGEVSLPHLLKSAQLMKYVMDFTESFLKFSGSGEVAKKGKIVLGTVFQDVHSIGKDLVKTLFENWGWEVIDLGSQVESGKFVEAAKKHRPFAIGMSALLVQTSNHMLTVAKMLEDENIRVPILIGGASVNWEFAFKIASAVKKGALKEDVFYCKTAMEGVKFIEDLFSDREKTVYSNRQRLFSHLESGQRVKSSEKISEKVPSFRPPLKFKTFVRMLNVPLNDIKINYRLLFNLNWKFGKEKTETELARLAAEWIEKSAKNKWLGPAGVAGIFLCNGAGDEIIGYSSDKKEMFRIRTKIARFFAPQDLGFDAVGLQLATAGAMTDSVTADFERQNDFFSAHIFQGLANRLAEDTAEFLHNFLREAAGVAQNTGIRVSPGYPAIKDMENNRVIYEVLKGEKIGVKLTDAFGFRPLAATAAVVCFNPEASYR